MKYFIYSSVALCFLFLPHTLFSQIRAVTSEGREVFLYADSTWRYAEEETPDSTLKKIDTMVCYRPKSSTFFVEGKRGNYGVWIDPKKWSVETKIKITSVNELMFVFKEGNLYAITIPEAVEAPLESLKEIILSQMKLQAPDARIVKESMRILGGKTFLCMQIDGTVRGMKFSYLSYYYSGENLTLQVLTWTPQNMFKKNKAEMESFLNGVAITLPKK